MAPLRDWPGWIQFTLSGMAGAALSLVTVTLTFADVRRDAREAKEAIPALERRVRVTEDASAWVKSALMTGRNPDTGLPLPWVK